MPRCIPRGTRLVHFLRHILTSKFFFLVTCISFTASYVWIQTVTEDEFPTYNESLTQEVLQNVAQDHRYAEIYRKKNKLPRDLKYMLLWTPRDYAPFYYLGSGQRAFIQNNCSVINCYVTTDKDFFGGDVTKFDAIAFNGRNLGDMTRLDFPKDRSPHQKYIFFNMESSDNYPICKDIFDGFFNWTSTYKLNSDIPIPYILIRTRTGKVVGPNQKMQWLKKMHEVDDNIAYKVLNKSKAAAWFVSHCESRSGRREFVKKLQKALEIYGLKVDIYGSCGPLQCPRERQSDCDNKLEKDYYFYMSMENSFAEDYVTEKLLTALQHDALPIVYGGANYSRFLPPSSYLDARGQSPEKLAAMMYRLMLAPIRYLEYSRWKYHYTYHDPSAVENICAVCAALNNRPMVEKRTVYQEFRKWWHPDYVRRCS